MEETDMKKTLFPQLNAPVQRTALQSSAVYGAAGIVPSILHHECHQICSSAQCSYYNYDDCMQGCMEEEGICAMHPSAG